MHFVICVIFLQFPLPRIFQFNNNIMPEVDNRVIALAISIVSGNNSPTQASRLVRSTPLLDKCMGYKKGSQWQSFYSLGILVSKCYVHYSLR